MNEEIIAKVNTIIDEKTLIINKGSENSDLNIGKSLTIFEPGPDIIDVDTNETIGRYDFIKEEVTVVSMHNKYSVCKKKVYEKSKASNTLSPLFNTNANRTYYYSDMNVDKKTMEKNEFKNPVITVGDPLKESK